MKFVDDFSQPRISYLFLISPRRDGASSSLKGADKQGPTKMNGVKSQRMVQDRDGSKKCVVGEQSQIFWRLARLISQMFL
jgi:hypothetical protein